MRFAWFDSTAATKKKTMENIRVRYFYDVSPITLLGGTSVVEEHLRVDLGDVGSDSYTHVEMLAEISIRYIEQLTGRHVMNKTAVVELHTLHDRIELPFDLTRITSFTYLNEDHDETSIVVGDALNVYKSTSPSVLEQKLEWPTPTDYALDEPYPWKLTCDVSGDFDHTSTSTTQTNRLFIGAGLMHLAHLYENREAAGFATGKPYVAPLAFESIIKTLKRIR